MHWKNWIFRFTLKLKVNTLYVYIYIDKYIYSDGTTPCSERTEFYFTLTFKVNTLYIYSDRTTACTERTGFLVHFWNWKAFRTAAYTCPIFPGFIGSIQFRDDRSHRILQILPHHILINVFTYQHGDFIVIYYVSRILYLQGIIVYYYKRCIISCLHSLDSSRIYWIDSVSRSAFWYGDVMHYVSIEPLPILPHYILIFLWWFVWPCNR